MISLCRDGPCPCQYALEVIFTDTSSHDEQQKKRQIKWKSINWK